MFLRLFEFCSFRELKLWELLKTVPHFLSTLEKPDDWFILYNIVVKLHKYKDLVAKGELFLPSDVESVLDTTLNYLERFLQETRSSATVVSRDLEQCIKSLSEKALLDFNIKL